MKTIELQTLHDEIWEQIFERQRLTLTLHTASEDAINSSDNADVDPNSSQCVENNHDS